ncbi:MAG: ABC transporter ATP-binding protein [Candidatus Acidifodinimicrobium sp.]
MKPDHLLRISNLSVRYSTPMGPLTAINHLSFDVGMGEIVGIVGESGSGKSTLAYAIIRLLPANTRTEGIIEFDGENILEKDEKDMEKVRGSKISMVFQDPMTSLNPLFRVKDQFLRVLSTHRGMKRDEGIKYAAEKLMEVEIPDPSEVLMAFPFELSGGMQQRVMIAMALSSDPRLIIADEPTTAVDATIQSQILRLLRKINQERNLSIMLITHNLGTVAELCDSVVIMYAGMVFERGPVKKIFTNPLHPYTISLLQSIPQVGRVNRDRDLPAIRGSVPDMFNLPSGCPFSPRCDKANEKCHSLSPKLIEAERDHYVACHLVSGEIR